MSDSSADNRTADEGTQVPGYWSRHLAQERKQWTKMMILFLILLTAIIMGILSLYWGGDHSLQFNMPAATIAIIDFDHGEVGQYMQMYAGEFRQMQGGMTLGYVNESGTLYDNDPLKPIHALHEERYWFAIVIQPNATSAMNYAYTNGNSSYEPQSVIHVLYEEARNALAIAEFMYPQVTTFLQMFTSSFTTYKQNQLTQQNSGNVAALELQVATPIPVSYTIYNEAPYVPSTAEAATEIGTIYLIIISFISVLIFDKLNSSIMGKVSGRQYVIYRMLLLPLVYFYLSLLYLALSCAWKIRFDKFYGGAGYFIYWMLSWCSMMAFGLVVDNFNNAIGQPFTPVFFVFWVISNVITGFYPTELLSNFYKWGIAWPLRHNLIGSKAIIFGTKNLLGLNFGVTLGWVFLSIFLQPFTLYLQKKRLASTYESNRKQVLERREKHFDGRDQKDA